MPNDMSKIALVREMLDSCQRSLHSARKTLAELTGDTVKSGGISDKQFQNLAKPSVSDEGQTIEGIFDGQNMVDTQGNTHPVPANYASKSKLVVGDQMKLNISPEGRFIYKCIGPVTRKTLKGTLTYEDGRYKILANGKAYNVLLASVTFNRAEVGDEISVFVPQDEESEWAAIDAVIPSVEKE
jgi:hypothetical protein